MRFGQPSNSNPRRGTIIKARLDPIEGSEQGGVRPVLVISSDDINDHSTVIIVVAITSKKTDRIYPFEVLLEESESGLHLRSKVMLLNLRTIDKQRITGYYGSLTNETMLKVEEALRIATALRKI